MSPQNCLILLPLREYLWASKNRLEFIWTYRDPNADFTREKHPILIHFCNVKNGNLIPLLGFLFCRCAIIVIVALAVFTWKS